MNALQVWAGRSFQKRARCRTCKQPFVLHVRLDTGKQIPIALDAKPVNHGVTEATRVHFDVYEWSQVHRCPKRS